MMRQNLSSRERALFAATLIVGVIFLGYQFFLMPLNRRHEAAEEGILTQQKLLNEKKKIIARAMAKTASYEYYKELFRQEGRSEQVMSGILKEIEEVARDLDIRIASLKPQSGKENQAYNEYSVSLNITTTFENSVQFLYNLQKQPFMFTVDKFDYDKRSRKGTDITVQLILSKTLIPD